MNLLDRYVAGQLAKPMIAILVAALMVLLAERMLRVVDIVIGWRGSVLVLFEMLGYLVPTYIGLALPAALFIAILLTVGRLSRDGEIDAMLSSGEGFVALLRPLLLTGLLIACVNFGVQAYLQPFSRYAYRAALFALSNVSFQALLKEGQFATLGNTTYTVDSLAPDHDSFGTLFLYSEREDGSAVTITAESGKVQPATEGSPTTLRLANGVQLLRPAPSEGQSVGTSATLRFRNFTSDLKGGEPSNFAARGEDERELTLPELVMNPNGFPERDIEPVEIAAELHVRLVRIAATLLLPLVAAPLAIAKRRTHRSYGFLIGIGLLLAFNQVVQLGKTLADDGQLSVGIALWLPLLAFGSLGAVLSWRKAKQVPSGTGATRLELAVERFLRSFRRRLPSLGGG